MFKSFGEIIAVGFGQCRVRDKKTQRFCYFLFGLAVYYFHGPPCLKVLVQGLAELQLDTTALKLVIRQHLTIVFMSYVAAIAWFVTSMHTKNYLGR